MKNQTGRIFFMVLGQLIKAIWSLLLMSLHIIAKLIEVVASLIARITEKLLNKN
tara:strand:- start:22 stop:183 length:162 start_codon:yes stop_codon:yes gene_type:complete